MIFLGDITIRKTDNRMLDWLHNSEGLAVFNLQGLSDPFDRKFQQRVRHYWSTRTPWMIARSWYKRADTRSINSWR